MKKESKNKVLSLPTERGMSVDEMTRQNIFWHGVTWRVMESVGSCGILLHLPDSTTDNTDLRGTTTHTSPDLAPLHLSLYIEGLCLPGVSTDKWIFLKRS